MLDIMKEIEKEDVKTEELVVNEESNSKFEEFINEMKNDQSSLDEDDFLNNDENERAKITSKVYDFDPKQHGVRFVSDF